MSINLLILAFCTLYPRHIHAIVSSLVSSDPTGGAKEVSVLVEKNLLFTSHKRVPVALDGGSRCLDALLNLSQLLPRLCAQQTNMCVYGALVKIFDPNRLSTAIYCEERETDRQTDRQTERERERERMEYK